MELVLANRSFLYALLARGFAEEPDAGFAEVLASGHARDEVCLVEDEATASIVSLYDELAARLAREGAVCEAAREYVRVFVGPGTLRANPWETVQLTGRRQLFQPGVLDVREAYRAAGFLPVRYREVPDDFVGIELDFMAKMAARACDEHASGDGGYVDTLDQSRAFLREHLSRWIGSFADSVEAEYPGGFYAAFIRFAALVVERDARILAEL